MNIDVILDKLMSVRFDLDRFNSGSGLIQIMSFRVWFEYVSDHSVRVSFERSTLTMREKKNPALNLVIAADTCYKVLLRF